MPKKAAEIAASTGMSLAQALDEWKAEMPRLESEVRQFTLEFSAYRESMEDDERWNEAFSLIRGQENG
jgi:hypothetical protein